jgi:hypothetical protein
VVPDDVGHILSSDRKRWTISTDGILAAKRANPQADMSAWEREIDQLVYQLYDLTPEEIAIVEESTRKK